ncbi:MAG TPA: ATP-binding protein [Azospirillaceae bacterium]|nr:ATP-binding protein [Azospirillaceae bacterium]
MPQTASNEVLTILQQIGLFAFVVLGYGWGRDRLSSVPGWVRQLLLGLFFGVSAISSMIGAVAVMPGVIVDGRTTMVVLAALFGGPLSTAVTASMAAGYRLWLGGAGGAAGIMALSAVAIASVLMADWSRRRRTRLDAPKLALAGGIATLASLGAIFLVLSSEQALRVFQSVAVPLLLTNSISAAFLGTLLRMQERRREVEAALARSETHYRALFDQASDCLFIMDVTPDGHFTLGGLNPASERTFGVPAATLLGKRPEEYLPDPPAKDVIGHLGQCVATRQSIHYEETLILPGGTRTWSTAIVPLLDETGRVARILGTARDITDQRQLVASLAAAKEQAEAAVRAKADFLAAMSHEIRTPMNGIIGYATFLEDLATTGDQRHYARQLKSAGQSLLAIINDILDFSKLEAGKVHIEAEDFNLPEAMDHVVGLVYPAARDKRLDLRLHVAPEVPRMLTGDVVRLRQVLLNLLTNAVKFTPAGSVTLSVLPVRVSDREAELKFLVNDTGIGIPPDKQALLFRKFSQVDPSISRRYGGTGLGLAICKRLVGAMGGTVGVHSVPEVGSTFFFTLVFPVGTALVAQAAVRDDRVVLAHRRGRILLAEDLAMNQELATRMLRAAGHDVAVVANGAQAVDAVRGQPFDLVLMDLQMPVMDGLQAAETIRALPGDAGRVPIVALTANVMPNEIARCHAVGIDDHLAKPIDRDALLAGVQRWLQPRCAAALPYVPMRGGMPADASAMVVDRAALDKLEAELGTDTLHQLLGMFLEHAPPRLRSAEGEASDWTRIRQDAHAMVSLAGNLGFSELMAASRALQQASADPMAPEADIRRRQFRQAGERAFATAREIKTALESRGALVDTPALS